MLSGLFFLLTILTYLKTCEESGRRRLWLLAGSAGFYILALASKGSVMVLPALLLVLDIYPLRQLSRRTLIEKIPFVLLGFTRSATTGVICAVFFVLYLQFENHVLSPLIVGRSVKLSPPATMTAALVGVSAGGVVGALVAVPVVAAAKAAYLELRPQNADETSTDG